MDSDKEYAGEKTIFDLPMEILFKIMILSRCSNRANPDVRLVCKHFYEIYCAFSSSLMKFQYNMNYDNYMKSMLNSLRRPKYIKIDYLLPPNASVIDKRRHIQTKISKYFGPNARSLQFRTKGNVRPIDLSVIIRPMINLVAAWFFILNIDNLRKTFQILITTSLPKLELLQWCNNNDLNLKFWASDIPRYIDAKLKEYALLQSSDSNIIKTMAQNFPNLKHLKIAMPEIDICVNVHDILALCPRMESLDLQIRTIFKGESTPIHVNMKHVHLIEHDNALTEMMALMPNLQSLAIKRKLTSSNELFLSRLQASLPVTLKNLELKFHLVDHNSIDTILLIPKVIKNITKYQIRITGNPGTGNSDFVAAFRTYHITGDDQMLIVASSASPLLTGCKSYMLFSKS